MEAEHTHIYRSEEGMIGGVCSAYAKRFDMDATLLRLLVVVLSIVSLGFFALVYLAVWLILPPAPTQGKPVDISPDSFRSEVYKQVVENPCAQAESVYAAAGVAPPVSVSPKPPMAASGYYAAPSVSYAQVSLPSENTKPVQTPISFALAVGIGLMALGVMVLLSYVFKLASFIQFWPLLLVAAGIVRMTIPAKDGSRTYTTWLGAFIAFGGLVALASSLGMVSLNLDTLVWQAGPFALIAVGLFIIGRASKSNIFILLAGLVLIVFIAVGFFGSFQQDLIEFGSSLAFSPDSLAGLNG